MYLLIDDAKNDIASPISSGSANRPTGTFVNSSNMIPAWSKAVASAGVFTNLQVEFELDFVIHSIGTVTHSGQMALIRIPFLA